MDLQFIFPILTFFIFPVFFLFKFVLKTNNNPKRKLPPGPPKLPLLGSILSVASLKPPHHTFHGMAKKYGPLVHLQLGEISAVVISSPRLAREALKMHGLTFADRPNLLVSKIVAYDFSDIAFAPYGSYWRQMRKICTLELLSAKKVREFRYIREDEVWKLVESIRSLSSSVPINLSEKIYKFSNVVTCRAAFGEGCKDQEMLIKMIQDLMFFAGGLHAADLFPSWKILPIITGMKRKLLKLRQNVDEIMDEAIKEHKEKRTRGNNHRTEDEDLLDVFLRIQEEGGLEFPITFDNIKAVILEMFGAGTDTSSAATEWAMSELMRNPRVMQKAQDELRQALKGKKIVNEIDIQGLSYLKLVIKETLRLHPPLPLLVPRECRESCVIDGYDIPIKTKLIVNAWAIGRDLEYWHDDAESFRPERFENNPVDFIGGNYEYIPFGAGKRICPGITFGVANVELPLAQLLYHFDWKLPGNMKPEELDMREAFGAAAKRENSLYLIPTPYLGSS